MIERPYGETLEKKKGSLEVNPGHVEAKGRGWPWWVPALAILAATMFVYGPALTGGFLWDDDACISENECLRTWDGLRQIWFVPGATEQYYPLTFSGFWLEYHLWGLHTLGYHLVNVLLHATAAILLWRVLAALRVRGALLAGAIFALHPVNVMSVAWMTELKNTLSGCLALGAGWAYVRFAGLGVEEDRAGKTAWASYLLSLALFQLAMLAKTAVSFLPVTLLLVVWWRKKRMTVSDVLWLLPMAGISVGMGVLTIYIEQHSGGASGPDFQLSFAQRLLVSGHSFWFYLEKLVLPCDLTFIYPRWTIDASDGSQYLYPLTMLGLLTALWIFRGRVGKGVWVAFMHFYLTTSMLVLIVVLFMMRYSFVSDHWQYFGSMGMLALFAAGITAGLDRLGWEGRPAGAAMKLGLLLALGVLSWRQSWIYQSLDSLWTDTLAKNPERWLAHSNLGQIRLKQGRLAEAKEHYEQALRIKPDNALVHANLGGVLQLTGQVSEAIELDRQAVQLDPGDAVNHYDLGAALQQAGWLPEAIAQFEEALRIKPDYADAHNNLGLALHQTGRSAEATEQFEQALRIRPEFADAHNNLGLALLQTGQRAEAMEHFEHALRIRPEFAAAHNNVGLVLLQQGQELQALAQFEQAVRIKPDFADAHFNLGCVLQQAGRVPEAMDQFKEDLRLNPNDAFARDNLAKLQALQKAPPAKK